MRLRTKVLIGAAAAGAAVTVAMTVAGSRLLRRFEPFVREQARLYLSRRFDSEVEIGALRLEIPKTRPVRVFMTRGRGIAAQVVAENIVLRHKGRRDIPPMFAIDRFRFEVDLGRVFDREKRVSLIHLEGMKIVVPPKGERPSMAAAPEAPRDESALSARDVLIERVILSDSRLTILPRDPARAPLEFQLHRVALGSVQAADSMEYDAELTNPKPPGLIHARGRFGPWNAASPGDTPLSGSYKFSNADLSVFRVIAGTLQSTGKFSGVLTEIAASGEATVPDFRLRMGGHPLPLATKFEALIDGTNGNTVLKPVSARLNRTAFVTSGAVLKHEGQRRRSIDLAVHMPAGQLLDLLTLTMKAKPPMSGTVNMQATIRIPPLDGKVVEKLILDGTFAIARGQFLRTDVQDKVDELSRRAQGQPGNPGIDDVFSRMSGKFRMRDQEVILERVAYQVPGAAVDLAGSYDLDQDALSLQGSVKLDAKVSQTMSGWKRWVLKPVDPFFSRNGAGTYLRVKIAGSSKAPKFSASR